MFIGTKECTIRFGAGYMNITGIRPYEAIGLYSNRIERKDMTADVASMEVEAEKPSASEKAEDYIQARSRQRETSFDYAKKYEPNVTYSMKGKDSDLSTLNIKKIAVIYDKAEKDENIVAAEEFEKKYGIDYSKDLKEKTKNIINQKITARNNAKELMDSSENNTENSK